MGMTARMTPSGTAPADAKVLPNSQPNAAVSDAAGASSPSPPPPVRHRRRWPWLVLLLLLCGGSGFYWWQHLKPAIPPGIAFSNGRLEADEVDIATKFAGRIAEIRVDEGDHVKAGQIVARIDTRDLEAQLAQADAQTLQAKQVISQNEAQLVELSAQLKLALQQLDRARALERQGYATRELLDQRQSQYDSAAASYHATQAQIDAATAAMQASIHNADLIRVNIADDTLIAPKDGPIQYRLTNVGEVLAAGGKVYTMLDVTYVYMDIFLPTTQAGKIKLGDEARILLDAWPDHPIPARVSFIASQNQFTPKMVETASERDKLMFRIRVRIDPDLLREHEAEVRSGLPGITYIRYDPQTAWPAFLEYKASQ